jgi:hypothetical protein
MPPPQPVTVAVDADACASVAVTACERSATQTYVVLEAAGTGASACTVEVLAAREIAAVATSPDMLPAPLRVDPGQRATFALSFLRPVSPEEHHGRAALRLDLRIGGAARSFDTAVACKPR